MSSQMEVILILCTLLHFIPPSLSGLSSSGDVSNEPMDECVNNSLDSPNCQHQHNQLESPSSFESNTRPESNINDDLRKRLAMLDSIESSHNENEVLPSKWMSQGKSGTLRQILLVHRHGDRTPISIPDKDPLNHESFWSFHGFGQLTNSGKARLHLLGHIMRERYDDFLNNSVNKNQRISRSSGSLRCIESAQAFLSSFLALDLNTSSDAKELAWNSETDPLGHLWQPAAIQSVPAKIDGMLAEGSKCNSLDEEYENVIDHLEEISEINRDYRKEGEILKARIDFDVDHFYKWFWAKSMLEIERKYFPDKMDPELFKVVDRVSEAGIKAYHAYQSTLKSKRLNNGLLIGDIVKRMKSFHVNHQKLRDSDPQLKKFVHYSAHDLTLIILLGMFDAWHLDTLEPKFGSNIVIELHEDENEWYVKVFYMNRVPSEPTEVHLERCESGHPKNLCTLDRFSDLVSPYAIDDWQTWMKECKNDFGSIDPYVDGN